ncbi:hypothetical protein [Wolbachia endosymbiont of Dactylopius coccus]
MKEVDETKLKKLLKEIKELLKKGNDYGFKPGLNYSKDGTEENTTLKIALEKGNEELLKLLYNYAKGNICDKILVQLKRTIERKEGSCPVSGLDDVSVSRHSNQTKTF